MGSYEFYASTQYMARTPKEPSYLFLVDISPSSVASNVPFYTIAALKEIIRTSRFNGEKCVSIAIVFFDADIHFVQVKTNGRLALVSTSYSTDPKFLPPSVS